MQKDTFNLNYVSSLARLTIAESEFPPFEQDLKNIMRLINQLQAIDTTDVTPMAHPSELPQRLREDAVTETDHHKRYQQIAPQVENDLYLVPKVIESE